MANAVTAANCAWSSNAARCLATPRYKHGPSATSPPSACGIEDRSAVLIYLNLAASQLYILADSGVLAVIPQNIWDDLAARTLRQFKAGGEVAALDSLIADSAALLRQHFGKPDDPHGNELPDNPVIIE